MWSILPTPLVFLWKANSAAWFPRNRERGEKEDGHGAEGKLSHDQLLTDANEAADFVKATGVDALAIAIEIPARRLQVQSARLPARYCGLTESGKSTSASRTRIWSCMDRLRCHRIWLKIINEHGGKMGETYGVPVEEIVEGIKHGVRKINIDTDLRMASTGAIRKYMAENPGVRSVLQWHAKR